MSFNSPEGPSSKNANSSYEEQSQTSNFSGDQDDQNIEAKPSDCGEEVSHSDDPDSVKYYPHQKDGKRLDFKCSHQSKIFILFYLEVLNIRLPEIMAHHLHL